ncbi:hypothetical protein KR026_010857 [Drosophila bipectinata]|nr:hypothetical protein KR026_010857 [Drosophila bipectinata]
MTRPDGLDAQDTNTLGIPGHNQTIVRVDAATVLGPGYVHRQVSPVDGAVGGDHVHLVDDIFAKVEWHDLGQDWGRQEVGRPKQRQKLNEIIA